MSSATTAIARSESQPKAWEHRPTRVDEGGRTDQGNRKSLPGGGGSELDTEGQGRDREGAIPASR